jgi:hypothetical protein
MASIKDYHVAAKKCEKQMWNMCKDRSQNHRQCVLPRCCAICYEITHCKGLCDYLKGKFKKDFAAAR